MSIMNFLVCVLRKRTLDGMLKGGCYWIDYDLSSHLRESIASNSVQFSSPMGVTPAFYPVTVIQPNLLSLIMDKYISLGLELYGQQWWGDSGFPSDLLEIIRDKLVEGLAWLHWHSRHL